MSIKLKEKSIALRKDGWFYSEIAKELGVAKSTAYLWAHAQEYNSEESAKIAKRLSKSKRELIQKLAVLKRRRQEQRLKAMEAEAKAIVHNSDLTHSHKQLICAVLFWCEGGKDVTSGLQFINSDPRMISKFLSLFRESFVPNESKFRALVHLHDYHDVNKQLQYWSVITKIPLSQFHRPYLKPHTGKSVREGYPGCVSVRYLDASLGKLLKVIYTVYSKTA